MSDPPTVDHRASPVDLSTCTGSCTADSVQHPAGDYLPLIVERRALASNRTIRLVEAGAVSFFPLERPAKLPRQEPLG
jgi:hypothetical protein